MHPRLDNYDWEQAFLYTHQPTRVPPGADVDGADFDRDDVADIVWMSEGDNEGPAWLVGGTLRDGRWFALSAWCDYTGWDCQAGGNGYVASNRRDIELGAFGDDDRRRLGIE